MRTDDDDDDESAEQSLWSRRSNRCLSCGYPQTWATQRHQFGRLLKAGFSRERAKAVTPRCQKCATVLLREHKLRADA